MISLSVLKLVWDIRATIYESKRRVVRSMALLMHSSRTFCYNMQEME
jgi:hypothetical protein